MVRTQGDSGRESTDERGRLAVARVCRAGIKAPESAILAWIRAVGRECMLSATLTELRTSANAF